MKKNILVVDDSALMRRVMCDIINSDSKFQATDYCRDGLEAYEKLKHTSYDGVVLDVNMPRMDGLQLLEKLQKEGIRANVVMVSTLTDSREADVTILAMERGAIDFVAKPTNIIEAKGEAFKRQLLGVLDAVLATQKTAGGIRVAAKPAAKAPMMRKAAGGKNKLVALACSTGGPKALQSVIPFLPKELDAPVVLVQHMPPGFTKMYAERLNNQCRVVVREAKTGDRVVPGQVLIAPGDAHMRLLKVNGEYQVECRSGPKVNGHCPSVDVLFESVAKAAGAGAVGIILTGMGNDGAKGLLEMRRAGAKTIGQNEASCIVYGMPKAAYDIGAVQQQAELTQIAQKTYDCLETVR